MVTVVPQQLATIMKVDIHVRAMKFFVEMAVYALTMMNVAPHLINAAIMPNALTVKGNTFAHVKAGILERMASQR